MFDDGTLTSVQLHQKMPIIYHDVNSPLFNVGQESSDFQYLSAQNTKGSRCRININATKAMATTQIGYGSCANEQDIF